ncbi:HSP70-domain-containing protein [Phanerochaete sordida]|uniref:HSP70-domain-containing protein n=1 Tax=Phanerochaete sordida TaxID=48140 RepID=A0A9P3LEU1_9APHY|nr:HSP70-domain-containing protein [Phanerochaete sordida]
MRPLILCLLLCLTTFTQNALASVLAIDYGSEWIKASLMSPGVPFDVLLDRNSKRKIQSTVAWKKEDRLFGGDAFNIAGRFPQDSFSNLKYLIAAPFDSPSVSYYASISTADAVKTSRGTVALRRSDGTEWAVEELIAMQLSYVRELAESTANEKVSDVILTIPPHFTQHERDAVVDAVEVAGMRTLALIHDGTAVAVNYAMTRSFPEQPEYHVIYDAGASSIRATVAGFSAVPGATKRDTATSIAVKGFGFDRNIGGVELDRRLREILINDFNKKHKKDIREDKRGMAKLWKEAGRVKAILSANADATASVESIAWDIDYRSKVSRTQFEDACKDLTLRYAKPIFDALSNAGLTLDNVTSVILTGGASRTPMIQAAVKAAVGESKIALNVNADEAAVLGAALHGAALSRQFKTKDIRVQDITPYDVQVSYQAESKSENAKPRTINTLVFPAGSKHTSKKTFSVRHKDDFVLHVNYKGTPVPGYPTDLLEVHVKGISEAVQNLTEAGAVDPIVKATLAVSESGFVSVPNAVVYGEIKDDTITGKLKGLFGGASSSTETEEETETAARPDPSAANNETAAEKEEKKEKPAPKDTIPLELEVKMPSLAPMTVAEKRTARDRLRAIDLAEGAKRRHEEARNTLEGYLYRVRDLLEEKGETPFRKCSKEQERSALGEKLDETFAWLAEHGEDASTSELIERRSALEKLEYPVVHRYKEIEEFPVALNNSQKWNWSTRLFLTDAKTQLLDTPDESKYTQEELDALERTLKEHEVWLNDVVEKQKRVQMYDDPAVESKELYARAKVLESQLQKLVKKKAPKKKKESSTSTTSSTATTATSAAGGDNTATPGHDEL